MTRLIILSAISFGFGLLLLNHAWGLALLVAGPCLVTASMCARTA